LNENGECTEDGGSLRIYPGSSNLFSSSEEKHKCRYVGINPINSRLLLFDSKLYHSVQEFQKDKSRLALTFRGLRLLCGLPNLMIVVCEGKDGTKVFQADKLSIASCSSVVIHNLS